MRNALITLFCLSATAGSAATWTTGTYTYDGAGNIKTVGAEMYQYDAFGRMTYGKIATGQVQTAEYDIYGNIVKLTTGGAQQTYGVDPQTNRMTQPTANVYATYDAAGRLITTPTGSDAFVYDAGDMITRSTVSGMARVHIYTVNDERLATLTPGPTEQSEWTVRDPSGRILRRFERSGSTWTWKQDYIYAGARLLASEVDTREGTLYYFPDHLGTPRLITGNGGVQVSLHTYYPFGEEATSPVQDSERRKFTGHERDYNSLDYMHARYYRPQWGRFLSVDPAMDLAKTLPEPQLWNRYSYVGNNPLNFTDPDGKERLQRYHFKNVPVNTEPAPRWRAPLLFASVMFGGPAIRAGWQMAVSFVLGNPSGARQLVEAALAPPGTSANPGLPGVAKQLATAERVGAALKGDPTHRAASFGLDAVAKAGQSFELKGGDGVVRTLIQAPGEVNGKAGVFEYIVNKAGQVTHQRFIEGGVITGLPNQKPPV